MSTLCEGISLSVCDVGVVVTLVQSTDNVILSTDSPVMFQNGG